VTQGARDVRNSSVRMQYKALLAYNARWLYGPAYLREKMSNFTSVFGKNAGFHGIFWLFFEPPNTTYRTKAYLRYLMSLAVILPLIAMLTAGPDRLYRVTRSHV